MNLVFQICFLLTVIGGLLTFVDGACDEVFNDTQGEIVTPGFPNRLNFTNTCSFTIDVGLGGIELRFQNISLPNKSLIGVDLYTMAIKFFTVGQDFVQPQIVYTYNHKTVIIFTGSKNTTDSYKGVKLSYRRIPEGSYKYTYIADVNENKIRSLGYPQNDTSSNSTSEYYIYSQSSSHVIHIGFEDMSFSSGDVFTMFDARDKRILLGPILGPQNWIRTEPTNSSAVTIVVAKKVASLAIRRYSILYTSVPKGKCVEDYYVGAGVERRFASMGKDCLYMVRAQPKTWMNLQFVIINITLPRDKVTIFLKNRFGIVKDYYLTSNDTGRIRNFNSMEQGYCFEIKTANVSFEVKFVSYTNEKCPFYKISETFEQGFFSLGYPRDIPRNSSCEYHIRPKDDKYVVHLRFSYLVLSPGDDVTVYDEPGGDILARYNETDNLRMSVTSKSSSLRVVFNAADTEPTLGRRFRLSHEALSRDRCLVEFTGKTGHFSSINRPCEFNLYFTASFAELKFENIYVPLTSTVKVVQKIDLLDKQKPLGIFRSEDSGLTKYFKNDQYYKLINIQTDTAKASFSLSFKPFVESRTLILEGPNGTILSPYYPESYIGEVTRVYHVQVPAGHVMLNFTEVKLASQWDRLTIYDGNATSSEAQLGRFRGTSERKFPALFLSSSNILTVEFRAFGPIHDPKSTYRFKAFYKMETQVKYCDAIKWPNSHAERNKTLPGRLTKYFCNEGYERSDTYFSKSISRKCNFNEDWEPGPSLKCLKICPRIDEKLKENSSLSWFYSSYNKPPYDGSFVRFSCSSYKEDIVGHEIITCTSHGNYTAAPPTCKKRPQRDKDSSSSNGWKYGVGIGGAAFIITIVLGVLRVFFGCFACCDTASSGSSMPMSKMN